MSDKVRKIYYQYYTFNLSCDCCTEYFSTYDVYEDGKLVEADRDVAICENEYDLRQALKYLEPFEVDPDSRWF